jgi:hypothetical protein
VVDEAHFLREASDLRFWGVRLGDKPESNDFKWLRGDSSDLNAASTDLQICFSFGTMRHFPEKHAPLLRHLAHSFAPLVSHEQSLRAPAFKHRLLDR